MQVAQLVMQNPKLTLKEIIHLATQRQIVSAPVSVASMHRALKKLGLKHRKAVFVDQRTQTDPLIVLERTLFREGQREDEMLLADKLLFLTNRTFGKTINNTLPGELPTCLHD